MIWLSFFNVSRIGVHQEDGLSKFDIMNIADQTIGLAHNSRFSFSLIVFITRAENTTLEIYDVDHGKDALETQNDTCDFQQQYTCVKMVVLHIL